VSFFFTACAAVAASNVAAVIIVFRFTAASRHRALLDVGNKSAPLADPIAKGEVGEAHRVDPVGVEDASGLVIVDEAPTAVSIDQLQMRLADCLEYLFGREALQRIKLRPMVFGPRVSLQRAR
jgi:hypothetical protein